MTTGSKLTVALGLFLFLNFSINICMDETQPKDTHSNNLSISQNNSGDMDEIDEEINDTFADKVKTQNDNTPTIALNITPKKNEKEARKLITQNLKAGKAILKESKKNDNEVVQQIANQSLQQEWQDIEIYKSMEDLMLKQDLDKQTITTPEDLDTKYPIISTALSNSNINIFLNDVLIKDTQELCKWMGTMPTIMPTVRVDNKSHFVVTRSNNEPFAQKIDSYFQTTEKNLSTESKKCFDNNNNLAKIIKKNKNNIINDTKKIEECQKKIITIEEQLSSSTLDKKLQKTLEKDKKAFKDTIYTCETKISKDKISITKSEKKINDNLHAYSQKIYEAFNKITKTLSNTKYADLSLYSPENHDTILIKDILDDHKKQVDLLIEFNKERINSTASTNNLSNDHTQVLDDMNKSIQSKLIAPMNNKVKNDDNTHRSFFYVRKIAKKFKKAPKNSLPTSLSAEELQKRKTQHEKNIPILKKLQEECKINIGKIQKEEEKQNLSFQISSLASEVRAYINANDKFLEMCEQEQKFLETVNRNQKEEIHKVYVRNFNNDFQSHKEAFTDLSKQVAKTDLG